MTTKNELTDEESAKIILQVLVVTEWFDFIKQTDKDIELIYYDEILNVRTLEKIWNSLSKFGPSENYKNFLNDMALLIKSDNVFWKWKEMQEYICDECSEPKLSEPKQIPHTHPEWIKHQCVEEMKNEEYNIVYEQECVGCGYKQYYSCGIEKTIEDNTEDKQ